MKEREMSELNRQNSSTGVTEEEEELRGKEGYAKKNKRKGVREKIVL